MKELTETVTTWALTSEERDDNGSSGNVYIRDCHSSFCSASPQVSSVNNSRVATGQ